MHLRDRPLPPTRAARQVVRSVVRSGKDPEPRERIEVTASQILDAAIRSINELTTHGRRPGRIRIHPRDMDAIIAAFEPGYSRAQATVLLDCAVELDESARLGEPVAEWT